MAVLKVLPKGNGMLMDLEAMSLGMRRFYGWEFDPKAGETMVDPVTKKHRPEGAFVKTNAVITLPNRSEYIRALKGDPRRGVSSADLWPADQATAQLAGVPFDPDYGGEYPSLTAKPLPSAPQAPAVVPAKAGS